MGRFLSCILKCLKKPHGAHCHEFILIINDSVHPNVAPGLEEYLEQYPHKSYGDTHLCITDKTAEQVGIELQDIETADDDVLLAIKVQSNLDIRGKMTRFLTTWLNDPEYFPE